MIAIILVAFIIICTILAVCYLIYRRNRIAKNKCIVKAHYYMFSLDRYDVLIYVTGSEKFSDDKIRETKSAILSRLNINEDDENLKEFGVSYLGYLSDTEFKRKEL